MSKGMKSEKIKEATTALYDLLGDKVTFFKGVFNMMEIAEEAIEEKKKEYPDYTNKVDNAFKHLCPSDVFHRFTSNERLYKKHCEEIIDRIIFSPKLLKYGTDAECLAALSIASLATPPSADYSHVYFLLFKKLFPDIYGRMLETTQMSQIIGMESYPGRADEILTWLKKKLITKRGEDGSQKKQLPLFP